MKTKVVIVGDGGWGTALAALLSWKGRAVTLWSAFPDYAAEVARTRENQKFLPGIRIPAAVKIAVDPAEALAGATWAVFAVPTPFLRAVAERFPRPFPRAVRVVSVVKGLEERTLRRPSEILTEALGIRRVAVLSGPSHAEEVARGLPAAVVIASKSAALAREGQELFRTASFRVYTSRDVTGVELGGGLKNVIGLAAGIADGLDLGDNAKAAMLTRGVVEMARLGVALGAKRETFLGLSGIGDLITTSVSRHGRNHRVGEAIGRGKKLADILKDMEQVAEGVRTCLAVLTLAKRRGVAMPITEEVVRILHEGKNPRRAVMDLMTREPRAER
ncbi:MAG: NAD(P)H-dependent glycerol-3-phosphate dehydrogenase [Planctomycetota bacterium]